MMWIWWPRSWRWKGKEPENAVVIESSSKSESTQSHALCSGRSGAEGATTSASCPSPSPYFSERIQSLNERRKDFGSELEFEVEASKSHWTEASVTTSNCESEEEQVPNSVVFEKLKEHPEWGPLFRKWSDKLEIGEKIGEGGQAEIFAATVTKVTDCCHDSSSEPEVMWDPDMDLVVKVFKDGFPLQDLQKLWPPGLASFEMISKRRFDLIMTGLCWPVGAVMLEDGRFAFIFQRMSGDLRKLIDGRMLKSNGTPPFTPTKTCGILRGIAWGMALLHSQGVLHRDLKAANALWHHGGEDCFYPAVIADFESSVGVVGTGFWRAPEVLLALKNRSFTAETFTKQSDVYSFAMTCYEVITGRLPFEGHPVYDYDVVLRGERPALPDETPSQLKDLVRKCWHQDPLQRPCFTDIYSDLRKINLD